MVVVGLFTYFYVTQFCTLMLFAFHCSFVASHLKLNVDGSVLVSVGCVVIAQPLFMICIVLYCALCYLATVAADTPTQSPLK